MNTTEFLNQVEEKIENIMKHSFYKAWNAGN